MPVEQMIETAKTVESETGYTFEFKEIAEVYQHTCRKCEINGKGESYIPTLFENELRDYIMRVHINLKGAENRCAKSAYPVLV